MEQARYYLAESYFQNGENLLASSEFERLNREFPQGKFADIALFKAGLAYGNMSRRPERDQKETKKSLDSMETLLAKYPNTKYIDTVKVHIRLLKDRLAQKELITALFYFKRKFYDSSIIYLKSILDNYPESDMMPSALYHLYLASDKMGYPDDARDAREWLCKDFPDSEFSAQLCNKNGEMLSGSTTDQKVKKEQSN